MRPTRAEIILPALRHNLELIRERAQMPVSKDGSVLSGHRAPAAVIPVVKANAYGHGAVGVSRELTRLGVEWLAVACVEEAVELDEAGIKAGLIVLGPPRAEETHEIFSRKFIPVISSPEDLGLIESAAKSDPTLKAKPLSVILDVDTGMGRMGFLPEQVAPAAERLRELAGLAVIGLFSHFAAAESADEDDIEFSRQQVQDFLLLAAGLREICPELRLISIANSGGIFFHPDSILSAVRPGISLYGVKPAPERPEPEDLRPVMRWVTEIVQVRHLPAGTSLSYGRKTVLERPSRIALLPVGYADGLRRTLPPGFPLFLKGKPVPICGVVTMDFTLVDVTDVPDAKPGDRVLIMGRDFQVCPTLARNLPPEQALLVERRVEDHARAAGTIPYEILTGVGTRVRRIYLDQEV